MSRSLIGCAIDAGTTTIVRVKSSGPSSCEMTACRTIDFGLVALGGPKAKKAVGRISDSFREWADEPVALTVSPASILTLPAWFPAGSSQEQRERLSRIEAGYFLKKVDGWRWDSIPLASWTEQAEGLERELIMFSEAEPARSLHDELGRKHPMELNVLHFEPIVRLTAGSSEPLAVLELEENYAAFFVSREGRAESLQYWPVKNASEREFFAIKELGSSPVAGVKVTGLAADPAAVKRIAAGASCTLEPLDLPPRICAGSDVRGCRLSTGLIRAASTALMALTLSPG